jgi:MYXO-CTERM domain-containing protein
MTWLAPSCFSLRSALVPGLAVAAAAVVLAVPAHARANSCTAYPAHVLPDESTPDVPTNTRIWYAGQAMKVVVDDGGLVDCDAPPRLLDAAGLEVPTTGHAFSFTYVLVPEAPLALGASYTVEHGCMFERVAYAGGIEAETTTFTVTAEADDVPPEPPDIAVGETEATEFENGFVGYSMDVDGEFEGILLVDIGQEAALDPVALAGEVSLASTDTEFVIGHACDSTWLDARPGNSTTVAFASFDLAGNFSGWTEPEPVTVEAEAGCQCRAGTGGIPTTGLGLLLGLLALRGRRRNQARTSPR